MDGGGNALLCLPKGGHVCAQVCTLCAQVGPRCGVAPLCMCVHVCVCLLCGLAWVMELGLGKPCVDFERTSLQLRPVYSWLVAGFL